MEQESLGGSLAPYAANAVVRVGFTESPVITTLADEQVPFVELSLFRRVSFSALQPMKSTQLFFWWLACCVSWRWSLPFSWKGRKPSPYLIRSRSSDVGQQPVMDGQEESKIAG